MSFDRGARAALIVACLTLLVCGVGFQMLVRSADFYLLKEGLPLRRPLTTISKNLGEFQAVGGDTEFTAELIEELGTRHFIDRFYVRRRSDGVDPVNVHVAYYSGMIDAVPHIPDRCMVAAGWVPTGRTVNLEMPLDRERWVQDPDRSNLITGEPYPVRMFMHPVTGVLEQVRMPLGASKIRTVEFKEGDNPDNRIFAGYFFLANGHAVPRAEGVRRYAFDLTTRFAYYTKIQFTLFASEETTQDDFIKVSAELAEELLPQLMLCLPDWAEVELASAAR